MDKNYARLHIKQKNEREHKISGPKVGAKIIRRQFLACSGPEIKSLIRIIRSTNKIDP
jgi:hypothetical protein